MCGGHRDVLFRFYFKEGLVSSAECAMNEYPSALIVTPDTASVAESHLTTLESHIQRPIK